MEIKTTVVRDGKGILVVQKTPYPTGKGFNKWDSQAVHIDMKTLKKIEKLLAKHLPKEE